MREIKFRAWDDNMKVMINPYCELRDGNFWGEDCTNTGISVNHEHVMQYTGLKDKKGREIYEQDVLEDCSGHHWIVEWHEDHACFGVRCENVFSEIIDNLNMKVVGNYHEWNDRNKDTSLDGAS